MAEKLQVFKCEVCGQMVMVVRGGAGQLVCCDQPMTLLAENTTDAAQEKHVPVIEKVPNGYKVKVGSVAHPMEEKHYIEWIELTAGDTVYRRFLKPGEAPEATFLVEGDVVHAREFCNVHGLWRSA